MDPWKLEHHDAWEEPGFHLTRLVLFVTGTGVWLLAGPRPAPAVALALAAVLVLQGFAEAAAPREGLGGGTDDLRWPVTAAWGVSLGLTLWTVYHTGQVALVGPLGAVVMGSATVLGRRRSLWVNAIVAVAATATAAQVAGVQGVLVTGAVLLAAEWSGDLHAAHRAERRRLRQAVAELAAAQARLAELAARSGELGARREREELLGALHDALGHTLTAQLLQVALARRLLPADPQGAAARLEAAEHGLREGLAQVRQLLRRSLHPARLPLASAVQRLADDFSAASGVVVEVVLEPDAAAVSDTDGEVAGVLYRAVQEALTNAARHGRARRVDLYLAAGERLRLRVQDDGLGVSELVPGMGLGRMTASIQRLGGTVRFETAEGKGFSVEVTLPRRTPVRTGDQGDAL